MVRITSTPFVSPDIPSPSIQGGGFIGQAPQPPQGIGGAEGFMSTAKSVKDMAKAGKFAKDITTIGVDGALGNVSGFQFGLGGTGGIPTGGFAGSTGVPFTGGASTPLVGASTTTAGTTAASSALATAAPIAPLALILPGLLRGSRAKAKFSEFTSNITGGQLGETTRNSKRLGEDFTSDLEDRVNVFLNELSQEGVDTEGLSVSGGFDVSDRGTEQAHDLFLESIQGLPSNEKDRLLSERQAKQKEKLDSPFKKFSTGQFTSNERTRLMQEEENRALKDFGLGFLSVGGGERISFLAEDPASLERALGTLKDQITTRKEEQAFQQDQTLVPNEGVKTPSGSIIKVTGGVPLIGNRTSFKDFISNKRKI